MNLSKEQEKAIQHIKGPALVLAVPGAGKTTVLIHRTVNLILNHKVSPERILSITFSRASAKDMKERFNRSFSDISSIPINFSTIHSFAIQQFLYNIYSIIFLSSYLSSDFKYNPSVSVILSLSSLLNIENFLCPSSS